MRFKSFEEFLEDYEKHGTIDKVTFQYYPFKFGRKKLNLKQLGTYYKQYMKKWEKKYGKVVTTPREQSCDSKLSAFVRRRDEGCRLIRILSIAEREEWEHNHNGLGFILDAAHVFGKNAFPHMRFDERNVVTLNRFSHNYLDQGKSPINGKQISSEEWRKWWLRIVGDADYKYLNWRARHKDGNYLEEELS